MIKFSHLYSNETSTRGVSNRQVVCSRNPDVCVTWWGTGVDERRRLLFRFGANQISSNKLKMQQNNKREVYETHAFFISQLEKCSLSGGGSLICLIWGQIHRVAKVIRLFFQRKTTAAQKKKKTTCVQTTAEFEKQVVHLACNFLRGRTPTYHRSACKIESYPRSPCTSNRVDKALTSAVLSTLSCGYASFRNKSGLIVQSNYSSWFNPCWNWFKSLLLKVREVRLDVFSVADTHLLY